mgnify:CR=1 FL=1
MKFDRCYKSHTSASAPCANAGTSCTHSADNGIIAGLDAILVASIIIYGLIVLLGLRLVTLLAILVLAGLVLVICKSKMPWCCESAI